ncbi:Asp23/Gls24 family envelope stress response protein [Pseudoclavibacter sp. RFBJ3]|uniref:Asp23/Gls24 family envelope stress response protein n=1 Tax=unclassified Pseudoclavibacter TaxID=2615177 RepID=UPI000CE7947A|nr:MULTISPECIES: Asp23/Gls24 family envelope stress response protein [unclassified Pseudoclavibacter]PPF81549.1 Asp23/Gls24 family envelope stress response protein [Pseudoclavibacter sp. RFBJ5]PPF90879.1 Asp23/Gls24 family envelope stress response protein [Pseudoclavibacter sp. RFBJ3]PPG00155.1 Asp23/Gls24 family envelope stress response protein [Pseudoclavibacter sp. RFBH5]PPG20013.1 Asp23/Gls24 family envelope stress response protein [Pseudoclavibacter sp. RFBI4]
MSNTTPNVSTSSSDRKDLRPAHAANGKTTIDDGVVAKVAGIAARDARGVYDLGGGAARAIGAIRNAINATDQSQGISVEVGEKQVAVDVTIVAEYPVSLQDVADGVRADVIRAVETIVGLEVTEVNVTVNDVHLPSEDNDTNTTEEARVQ